jgi:acyl carrier protein
MQKPASSRDLLAIAHALAQEATGRDLPPFHGELSFVELGIDSFTLLETVGMMERELSIELPFEMLDGVTTVGGIVELLQRQLAGHESV